MPRIASHSEQDLVALLAEGAVAGRRRRARLILLGLLGFLAIWLATDALNFFLPHHSLLIASANAFGVYFPPEVDCPLY